MTLLGSTGVSLAVPNIYYKDFNKQVGANKIGAIIDIILRTLLKSILGVEAKSDPKLVSSAAVSNHSAAPAGMMLISNTTKQASHETNKSANTKLTAVLAVSGGKTTESKTK